MKKLEIGDFYVKDIVFGEETKFENGILTVNKAGAVKALNPDGKLKNVDLRIARPGESVRILPIKAAVEPRARANGRAAFPGYTGAMTSCGDGVLYALKNMSVMAVGKYGGWMEGIVDMSGPGAELTNYGRIINLCFVAENADPNEDQGSQHKNLNFRIGAHLLAEYIGKSVLGKEPDKWERFELTDVSGKKLPRVALVSMLSSFYELPDFDDVFYGFDVRLMLPTLVHPNEILDGALCSSSLIPAGNHSSTYDYQNFPILKKLYSEHGKTIDFVGVIFSTMGMTLEKKDRAAIRLIEIASLLHCDGVIYSQQCSGNPDVDFFKGLAGMEKIGIKTVGMTSECCGRDGTTQVKVVLDAKADAIVSTANADQILELPAMDIIIGDLESVRRDSYPGCWTDDPVRGPSLRADGSLIMDATSYLNNDGQIGWSNKTCKSF
ncbi:glycine/sarcosine/betaine reductase component B subunit [Cloacibacillus evryensis]|uniref:glycine/sarcosine/betaine reductase component B subunit n=1 Tax=Cloacibacillus evryensis TaxID=508460 RepID=UPI0026DF22FF|nr:glycine/sarcosine/betaine reductase component B subunit [Cloacibacillus evryensis]